MSHRDHDCASGTGPCRRAVLASGGALGALGVATLAGCGSSPSEAMSSATNAVSSAVKDAISKVSIPVGGGKVFPDQKIVVTQPTSGDFKAFSAVCTHQGCIVADVSGGTINCSCHGSAFDVTTGAVTRGPATSPLPEKKVSISGNGITVS
jgi:Rieske Fe-S protein